MRRFIFLLLATFLFSACALTASLNERCEFNLDTGLQCDPIGTLPEDETSVV